MLIQLEWIYLGCQGMITLIFEVFTRWMLNASY